MNHQAVLSTGEEAVQRTEGCSWWDWDLVSSIFFLRWPDFYQDRAQEGHPPMFTGNPSTSKILKPPYYDASVRQKVKDKIQRLIDRGYIMLRDIEEMKLLMFFFHVPKVKEVIRMVYDRSKSGLNSSLCAQCLRFQ